MILLSWQEIVARFLWDGGCLLTEGYFQGCLIGKRVKNHVSSLWLHCRACGNIFVELVRILVGLYLINMVDLFNKVTGNPPGVILFKHDGKGFGEMVFVLKM